MHRSLYSAGQTGDHFARATRSARWFLLLATVAWIPKTLADDPPPPVPAPLEELPARPEAVAAEPRYLFTVPACLPACTEADRRPLAHDNEIMAALLAAIGHAKQTIDFSTYTFSSPPLYAALIEAVKRGVSVRGLVDRAQLGQLACTSLGCHPGDDFDRPEYVTASVSERLKRLPQHALFRRATLSEKLALLLYRLPDRSGVRVAPGARRLMHHKLAIIDGSLVLTGSGNWSTTATSVNLENLARFTAQHDPEIVAAFRCMYELLWSGDAQRIARDLATCQRSGVYFTPAVRREASIMAALIEAMDASQQRIDISMHHLVQGEIYDALARALDRRVTVRILLDDDDCNRRPPLQLLLLRRKGAQIRYMPTNCKLFQLSHNKFGIFDGARVINGAGNWSQAGLLRNYENFFDFTGPEEARPFAELMERLWPLAVERSACRCNPRTPGCRERYCIGRRF